MAGSKKKKAMSPPGSSSRKRSYATSSTSNEEGLSSPQKGEVRNKEEKKGEYYLRGERGSCVEGNEEIIAFSFRNGMPVSSRKEA